MLWPVKLAESCHKSAFRTVWLADKLARRQNAFTSYTLASQVPALKSFTNIPMIVGMCLPQSNFDSRRGSE